MKKVLLTAFVFLSFSNLFPQLRQFNTEFQIRCFADVLFLEKDYLRAIEEYKRLSYYLENDSILLRIGFANLEMGFTDEAINIFQFIDNSSSLSDFRDILVLKSLYIAGKDSSIENYQFSNNSRFNSNIAKLFFFSELRANPNENLTNRLVLFETEQKDIVKDFILRKTFPRSKNETMAGILSFIVPGAGKIYCNRLEEGIAAFVLTVGTAYLSYSNFKANHNFRGWLFGGLATMFYAGNIYGSVLESQKYNLSLRISLEEDISIFLNEHKFFVPELF